MAVSNEVALENLLKQRDQLIEQVAQGQQTVLKMSGAIEVLQQLIESPEGESVAAEAAPEAFLGTESETAAEESTEE